MWKLVKLVLMLALSAIALPARSGAIDGAIEVNQARVDASGGFPFVIASAGHYVLTGNLASGDANVDLLRIDASNVTLDLNGFRLEGPVTCSGAGAGLSCSGTGAGRAIHVNGSNVTIRDGTVRGAGSDGISASGRELRVRRIRVVQNGGAGVRSDFPGAESHVVERCVAWRNAGDGLVLGDEARALENMAIENGGAGIAISGAALLLRNLSARNALEGLKAVDPGALARENLSGSNGGVGLELGGDGGYGSNVLDGNTGGAVGGTGAPDEVAPNICDGDPNCP